MKKQYRIIKIVEPNGNYHYVVQQSYWLFGTRWRERQGPEGAVWDKEYTTIESAKKDLELHLSTTTVVEVEVINDN